MASPAPKQADGEGPPVLCETSCPVDFTQISPSKFGISTQSFTPSLSKRKDKSQLAKIKSLRRSSIGARGSPGTNALIRFMAQQRAKTPPVLKTPEAFKSSPFPIRVSSTLKEKMASFQSLMDVEDVEEGEQCEPVAGPKQDLSDGGLDSDKENCSPRSVPSKRRRVGPPGDCVSEISGASSPILQHFSSQADPEVGPSSFLHFGKEASFEVQSARTPPKRAEPVAVDLPAQRAVPFPSSPSSPALLEMKPFVVPSEAHSALKNKKQVRFGGPLSPEFFDKNLPPSTPLQKGTTPARAQPPTPGPCPGSGLRSLLKTPQRPAGWTPLPQPLFCSPTFFGASPTLSLPRQRGAQTPENNWEKIEFPSMEETDSPSLTDGGGCSLLVVQSLDLSLAFGEESFSEALSGGAADAAEPGALPVEDPQAQPEEDPQAQPEEDPQAQPEEEPPLPQLEAPGPEPEPTVDAPASSDTPIKKARSGAQPPLPAPVQPVSRKRKQPTVIEPVKRSSRSAAKSACGKMKKARRWGSKEVDRSLYGHRDYASKNPALSPITEGLGGLSPSPPLQPPGSRRRSSKGEDPAPSLSSPASEQAVSRLSVPGEVPSPVPLPQRNGTTSSETTTTTTTSSDTSDPQDAPANAAVPGQEVSSSGRKPMRSSRAVKEPAQQQQQQPQRRRRPRKVSVPVDAWHTEAPLEEPAAPVEGSESSGAKSIAGDGDGQSGQPLDGAAEHPGGVEAEAESHPVVPAPTAPCPPPEGDAVEGAGRPEVRTTTTTTTTATAAPLEPTQQEAPAELAPWQMDFTMEDVFKRVATRGQRSVRRSLRNQKNNNNVEHCGVGVSGLAWLPHSSPESLGESRRKARRKSQGRRVSATLALKTPRKT